MHLPNLSGLSLRNDAPTDVLIRLGTAPPPPAAPPASQKEMLQCIRDKVRTLVYTDQMINELFDGDYSLAGKDDYYVHNDIVPYGGQYLPGVLQASYDYEVSSETKFVVKVNVALQNSICGETVQTRTFEFEYEDTLYEELEEMLKFFEYVTSAKPGRANTDAARRRMVAAMKKWAKNPRAQEREESLDEYGKYLMINCFTKIRRPWLYILNGLKEGEEGLPFTTQMYDDGITKMFSDNPAEAKEFDDYIESIYPKKDFFVPNLHIDALDTLNKRAVKAKRYPYPGYKFPKTKDGRGPLRFSENVVVPRSFWLLFVLQAIEKTLLDVVESVLYYPPPEPPEELKDNPTFKSWVKQIKGGPVYELWKKEAQKIEEGSSDRMEEE